MKKFNGKIILGLFAVLAASSCATTSKTASEKTENPEAAAVKEFVNPEETQFIETISKVKIDFLSTPKYAALAKRPVTFAKPYTILVSGENGEPLADFGITYQYPSEIKDGEVIYTEATAVTDEKGTFSFIPEKLTFPCKGSIIFYPTPSVDTEKAVKAAKEKSVSAEWLVRSSMINTGALLFVWEFNEKNRPTRNSYSLLSQLKAKGVWNIGNAPINESSDLDKSLKTLYRENYEIVENAYGFLICGTVKFTKPVEPVETGKGYLCSLVAEISAVDMKNGNVVYTKSFAQEAVGVNWNEATTKCKEELSNIIADSLIYGL